MINVVTIVGARPQFIKAAMVSKAIMECEINEIIIHTGQHYDDNMSKIFFDQMGIPSPSYNLHIQERSHGKMTGKMLAGIEEILMETKPDFVLVYGDTNSTLAGALAARKLNIPLAHVEGGLRNFDFTIPEDVNRTLTDRLSSIIFCPTPTAVRNLENEGYLNFDCKIVRTGDLMADSVYYFSKLLDNNPHLIDQTILDWPKGAIIVTIHRQETTRPEILSEVVDFLNEISQSHDIIFPIHPRTKNVLKELGLHLSARILMVDPVGYLEMQFLLKSASHVITDSGGLQKEAYLHGKKSLLLMDFTPWVELVEGGYSVTTPLRINDIRTAFEKSLQLNGDFKTELYGKGDTRYQIIKELETFKR